MNYYADFHVHPDYSIDAIGTIREYCDRALEIGLKAICFTTHYDTNPRRIEIDGYWNHNKTRVRMSDSLVYHYLDEVEQAKKQFAPLGFNIYRGLEIDYYPGVEPEVKRLRNKIPLDFVLGSVHCIEDISISSKTEAPPYFERKTIEQMADDYFNLLRMAAACREFDSIGHLDYYVRYIREYYGDDMEQIEIERFDAVFDTLKKSGVGIEVNTSQFKSGVERFHPNEKILERAIAAGVKIASVGSDSHKPSVLGMGLKEAYDYLSRMNIVPQFPRIV